MLGQEESNRKYSFHHRIFGWQSIRTTSAYALMGCAFLIGVILGASPLFQGTFHNFHEGVSIQEIHANHRIDYNDPERLKNMPKPITKSILRTTDSTTTSFLVKSHRPRLLFMTATYTMDQLKAFQMTLDCMRDICNAGWNVTIHVQSASDLSYAHERYAEFQSRLWCADSESHIPLVIENYKKIGFGLNSRHRLFMREHVRDFDYFSFAEEDMLLTISHLKSFIRFQSLMKKHLPKTHLRYTIGFMRYEDSILKEDTERVSWEYVPALIHVADMGPELGKFVVTNNLNQAIYLLSQEQVADLENRCHFLSDIGQNAFYKEMRRAMDRDWKYLAAGVSEWSSSFQQVLQCGMRRVTPLEGYESFMIHHAVDKAQTRRPRKELLNARDLHKVVEEKAKHPITIEEAYDTHIYNQYNLGLMDISKFSGKSLWSWGVDKEEPSN